MAKSLDVAVAFLEKSIELGKKDSRYYMDFVKLHKLMYLGQCFISSKFDMDLFEEDIIADPSGPIVNGLEWIPACCGFAGIYDITKLKGKVLDMPLSYFKDKTVNFILEEYGKLSTEELVKLTKNTLAYNMYVPCIKKNDASPIIQKRYMKKSGNEIFHDILTSGIMIEYRYPQGCPRPYKNTEYKIRKKTL